MVLKILSKTKKTGKLSQMTSKGLTHLEIDIGAFDGDSVKAVLVEFHGCGCLCSYCLISFSSIPTYPFQILLGNCASGGKVFQHLFTCFTFFEIIVKHI